MEAFDVVIIGAGPGGYPAAIRAAQLGASVVGPHATELIAEATAAIRAELTVQEIGRTIHAHPTFSEAWMEAAHSLHGEAIHALPGREAGGRRQEAAPRLPAPWSEAMKVRKTADLGPKTGGATSPLPIQTKELAGWQNIADL